uniref:F-box/kelch-repeat protein At3g23880-like n=1 Tax=Erigeron canadensis TaxID=72917 RepID=UPI001CB9CE84|nr:F-box/kelch-repeat protein At3g23880-like [Erigeron canadensis]
MAYIYSLKSGNWKIVNRFPQGLRVEGNGTFLNGALHWLAGGSETRGYYLSSVVTFDLATGDFLWNFPTSHGDLWVMKVHGVTNSWVKLFSIPYPTDLMRNPFDAFFAPLCILDDGKILLQFGSIMVLYDLKNRSLSEIQKFDKWHNAITFVESLVSPNSLAVVP